MASDALYQAIAYIAATQRPTQFYCANTTLYSGNRIPITHVTKTQQCSHRDGLSSADSCLTAYPSINWACHWQLCWCNKQQCHLSHAVTTISHCVHHMWYTHTSQIKNSCPVQLFVRLPRFRKIPLLPIAERIKINDCKQQHCRFHKFRDTRAIPKVSGLDILDNNIFHNLYISETYILYKL